MTIPEQIKALVETLVAARFDELMLSLQAGQIPVKLNKAVEIEGAKTANPILQLNLSQPKFIEVYNEIPTLLQAYAIAVDWTDYQNPTRSLPILHPSANSNYWVIPAQTTNGTIYWLVPNPRRQIRFDKLHHLGYLFEYPKINPIDRNSEFYLVKPGIVSYYFDTGVAKWKLEQPGEIAVSGAISKYDPAQLIAALQQQMIHQAATIHQLQQKFDLGFAQWQLEQSKQLTVVNDEITESEQILQPQTIAPADTIEQLQAQLLEQATTTQQVQQPIEIVPDGDDDTLKQALDRAINIYNNIPEDFCKTYNLVLVEESQSSIKQRLTKTRVLPVLARTKQPTYLIVRDGEQGYIFPNFTLRINQDNLYIIDALFDKIDYDPAYTRIHVNYPAIAHKLGNDEQWIATHKGSLTFITDAQETPPTRAFSAPQNLSLIEEYNQNINTFIKKYSLFPVCEEIYNWEARRSGQLNSVYLSITEQNRGDYWVLSHDRQHLLVPSTNLKINKFNQNTIEALFDCVNFNPNYHKIWLIQPAIVEMKSDGYQLFNRNYKLFIKGKIVFE